MSTTNPREGGATKSASKRDTKALKPTKIKFTASLGSAEIKSRGVKLWLSVPESDIEPALQLMQARSPESYLELIVTIKQRKPKAEAKKEKKKGRGVRRSRFGEYKE